MPPRPRTAWLPLVLAAALAPVHGGRPQAEETSREPGPAPVDRYGDPLPPGALARFGTTRLQHGKRVSALAYSPDGRTLASGADDGTVRLWESATGRERACCRGSEGTVHCLAFAPDGQALAAGDDTALRLWDAATGKL